MVLAHAGLATSAATEAALDEMRDYHARENLWEVVPAEVVPVLARLRALGCVWSWSRTPTAACGRCSTGSAWPHLDDIIDSIEVGYEKPDPDLPPGTGPRRHRGEASVHVGDLYHVDVVGARAAGIRGVLLDSADSTVTTTARVSRSLAELADLLER